MSKRLLLGMGSGTSADGLDFALLAVEGEGLEKSAALIADGFTPYSSEIQADILQAGTWNVGKIAQAHLQLGDWMGKQALAFLKAKGVEPEELTAIGSHGQTVYHHDGDCRGTLQLGDLSVIAERAGVAVVGDFRWSDLAAGGEGAPISPYGDWVLHRQHAPRLAILNWGGLGNITLLEGNSPPRAWDTGPANGPLDALCRAETGDCFDQDGRLGLQGSLLVELFEQLKKDSFFGRSLPRSTGLERFGASFAKKMRRLAPEAKLEDLLATASELAAWSVVQSLDMAKWGGGPIFLAGGGAHNPCLIKALEARIPSDASLQAFSDLGWNPDSREASAFALLADAFLLREVSAWPGTTGSSRSTALGRWVPGPNS
ncbi:MAG TPA: anhydro-N-acetylmuramic acid kinase [Planctomycetota bacterium]|nr:hypothetical protein [Planctomycetota bacterium]MDP7246738.1 anhydro-N-acetylmuramic acid kinase [Planctomycetota bacterium]HJM40200.1 anhydro-N-acetylmuramic acid kinase [Planctomycetota bacterium]